MKEDKRIEKRINEVLDDNRKHQHNLKEVDYYTDFLFWRIILVLILMFIAITIATLYNIDKSHISDENSNRLYQENYNQIVNQNYQKYPIVESGNYSLDRKSQSSERRYNIGYEISKVTCLYGLKPFPFC